MMYHRSLFSLFTLPNRTTERKMGSRIWSSRRRYYADLHALLYFGSLDHLIRAHGSLYTFYRVICSKGHPLVY